MSFISEFEALAEDGARLAFLGYRLVTDPEGLFKELRDDRPVWNTPLGTFVTGYDHVMEAMNCHQVFSVRLYNEKMQPLVGTYPLGVDDGADYLRDASLLRLSVAAEDADHVQALADDVVQGLIAAVRQTPGPVSFDLVKDFAYRVPTQVLARYFGMPGGAESPGDLALRDGLDAIFCDIFDNLTNNDGLHQAAMTQAGLLLPILEQEIAEIGAGKVPVAGALVIPRLVALRAAGATSRDDLGLAQLVLGTIAGVVTTIAIVVANVANMLLTATNASALVAARTAATANDNDALWLVVREAMRFAPPAGFQLRYAERAYTFDLDNPGTTTVNANARVLVCVGSAMLDERRIPSPKEFRTDRGAEDYLMFGVGMHRCLGRFIAPKILVSTIGGLLRAFPDLQIAPGKRFEQDMIRPGFPVSLPVVAE